MFTTEMLHMFRSQIPVIALESPAPEELATLERIVHVGKQYKSPVFSWDLSRGIQQIQLAGNGTGIYSEPLENVDDGTDPLGVLNWLSGIVRKEAEEEAEKDESSKDKKSSKPMAGVLVLLDFEHFLYGPREDLGVVRGLKNLCFALKQSRWRVVIMAPQINLPETFNGLVYHLINPLPNEAQCVAILENALAEIPPHFYPEKLSSQEFLKLTRACIGLTEEEIHDALRLATTKHKGITFAAAEEVQALKIKKLTKLGVTILPPLDFQVGGLQNLKLWLEKRATVFKDDKNLPKLKGIFLAGPPGTGKTLTARSIGHEWGIPVLSLDMGKMFGSHVGESEQNLRQVLEIVDMIDVCILFMDEVDKALSGMGGSGDSDGGTGNRMLASFLAWMNDRTSRVFIVVTANNIQKLPPEFLRKGRFSELFFVDLPSLVERKQILQIHLNRYNAHLDSSTLTEVAEIAKEFSGAELAAVVEEAVFEAHFTYGDRSKIDKPILTELFQTTIPLAKSREKEIQAMRDWASNSAKPANLPDPVKSVSGGKGHRQWSLVED